MYVFVRRRSQDASEHLVTSASNMLITALAIWLIVVLLSLGCLRVAASADSRELELIARYPLPSAAEPLSDGRPSSSKVSPLTHTSAPQGRYLRSEPPSRTSSQITR